MFLVGRDIEAFTYFMFLIEILYYRYSPVVHSTLSANTDSL